MARATPGLRPEGGDGVGQPAGAGRLHAGIGARGALTASPVAALEAIGVLGERDGQGEDVELIARRTAQAEALEALLRFTDQRVQAMEETEPEEAAET